MCSFDKNSPHRVAYIEQVEDEIVWLNDLLEEHLSTIKGDKELRKECFDWYYRRYGDIIKKLETCSCKTSNVICVTETNVQSKTICPFGDQKYPSAAHFRYANKEKEKLLNLCEGNMKWFNEKCDLFFKN